MVNRINIYFIGRANTWLIPLFWGIPLLILSVLIFWLPDVDQPALTAPLVGLSVIFTLCWFVPLARNRVTGKLDWFHPSILLMLMYFAYIIFPGVWVWLYHNYHSIWVDFGSRPAFVVNLVFSLGFVSMFSFGLGMRTKIAFPRKPIRESFNQPVRFRFSWKGARYLILLFLIIGGAFKFYHLSLYGPLNTDILRFLSPFAHRGLGINISQFIIMLESMLDWAALLVILYYIVRYKETGKTKGWWLVLLMVIIIAMLDYVVSAKRSAIIPFLLFPLIWYHYIIKRLSITRAGIYFLVGMIVIVGLLMARIVLPLRVQNLVPVDYIGDNPAKIVATYVDSGEFSTFDLIAASVIQRAELLTQAGGSIMGFLKYSFSTMIIFIPRAIWPEKPGYEDLSYVYYRVLIGPNAGIGFAPTIWGSSFLFFNLAGLIIGMYFLGLLSKSIYAMFQPQNGRPYNVFFYSIFYWMAFQFIRFGTTGFVLVMFVQSMVVGVLAGLLLWRKSREVAPPDRYKGNISNLLHSKP